MQKSRRPSSEIPLAPTFSLELFFQFTRDLFEYEDPTVGRRTQNDAKLIIFILSGFVFGGAACAEMLFRAAQWTVRRQLRKKYYAAENRRRQSLRRPNRHIRERTTRETVLPSPEVLMGQWVVSQKRGAVLEKVRLGAMLAEIESCVDNSLIRNENHEIIGRRPGLRGWLRGYCPELAPHYKTLMRYKSMADKLQTIGNLDDPDSVIVALPPEKPTRRKPKRKNEKRAPEPAPNANVEACREWLGRRPAPWASETRFLQAAKAIGNILATAETTPSLRGANAGTLRCLEDLLFETLGIEREVRPREKRVA